jgi:monofunctional biosynthetic peptidoglycan transglycosylase
LTGKVIQTAWEKKPEKKAGLLPAARPSASSWQKTFSCRRAKTPWRKAEEAIITLMLEKMMSKRRIFEIYMNVIEWGNGVFGAEAAAHAIITRPAPPGWAHRKRQNWRQWCPTRVITIKTVTTAGCCARRPIIQRRMWAADLP